LKRIALLLAAVIVLALLLHSAIFAALAGYLVNSAGPEKSDTIFVLGGDWSGNRILKAAELVRAGYAPQAIISGPGGIYDHYECDLAIPFAVKRGYPDSYFVHFEHHAHSTGEEAGIAIRRLREMGAHKVLLVTSDYHTRRAGKIFRHQAPDMTFDVVSAPDEYFTTAGWWHDREGRKTFLIEWMKTVAEWLGL
jgi:uncharacterized SAM-binding protein YcdF (DUF218 family)